MNPYEPRRSVGDLEESEYVRRIPEEPSGILRNPKEIPQNPLGSLGFLWDPEEPWGLGRNPEESEGNLKNPDES
eukprot:3256783-Pyramimonas_sp.AAC.1